MTTTNSSPAVEVSASPCGSSPVGGLAPAPAVAIQTGNGQSSPQGVNMIGDKKHLANFELLRDQIRDRTDGVAFGYQTGFYLVGRAGTSKTFTVKDAIARTKRPSTFRNARMTPMGLFSLLDEFPSHTLVLDDVTELFTKVEAQQIFLAALDGEPGKRRPVTYVSNNDQRTVQFSGGIIAISNMPLRRDPVLNALKSRVIPLEFEPTDEQIAAFMRHLAKKGLAHVKPAGCNEVVEYIIAESKTCDQRLDLRHLTKALRDYRQHRDGPTRTAWRDLVRSSLRQQIVPNEPTFAEMQKEKHRKIASELQRKYPGWHDKPSRDKEWTARTKTSPATFYRRIQAMK